MADSGGLLYNTAADTFTAKVYLRRGNGQEERLKFLLTRL